MISVIQRVVLLGVIAANGLASVASRLRRSSSTAIVFGVIFTVVLSVAPVTSSSAATISGIYYTSEGSLRRVGFDGTSFQGSFEVLELLQPDWTATSYDPHSGSLYYVAESSLRRVGFDGTSFQGSFEVLELLQPDWTATSYDPHAGFLYYAADSSLRRVGFDGTTFQGSFEVLELLQPDWTALSLDPYGSFLYYTAESSLRRVGFNGTSFQGSFEVLELLQPDWTGMSLIFASNGTVPEPGTLALLGLGVAALAVLRRRRREALGYRDLPASAVFLRWSLSCS